MQPGITSFSSRSGSRAPVAVHAGTAGVTLKQSPGRKHDTIHPVKVKAAYAAAWPDMKSNWQGVEDEIDALPRLTKEQPIASYCSPDEDKPQVGEEFQLFSSQRRSAELL